MYYKLFENFRIAENEIITYFFKKENNIVFTSLIIQSIMKIARATKVKPHFNFLGKKHN